MFNDDEWDGEPVEPVGGDTFLVKVAEIRVAVVQVAVKRIHRRAKLKIKLSDGKVREIQSMSSTYFYVDGKPISAEEFLKRIFNVINTRIVGK